MLNFYSTHRFIEFQQRFFRKKSKKEEPVAASQPVIVAPKRTVDDDISAFESLLSAPSQPQLQQPPAPTPEQDKAARKIQRAWRTTHPPLPPLSLLASTSHFLPHELAHELRKHVPRRLRNSPHWRLLYSLSNDGSSLNTLYSRLLDSGPVLISLQTTKGRTFGAFISEQIRVSDDGRGNARAGKSGGYYGTGESFLWRLLPGSASSVTANHEFTKLPSGALLQIHPATQENEYFISTQSDCIILGGGGTEGSVALYIGEDLYNGYSDGRSPTFGLGGIALGAEAEVAM